MDPGGLRASGDPSWPEFGRRARVLPLSCKAPGPSVPTPGVPSLPRRRLWLAFTGSTPRASYSGWASVGSTPWRCPSELPPPPCQAGVSADLSGLWLMKLAGSWAEGPNSQRGPRASPGRSQGPPRGGKHLLTVCCEGLTDSATACRTGRGSFVSDPWEALGPPCSGRQACARSHSSACL